VKSVFILAIIGMLLISAIPASILASSDNGKDKETTEVVALFGTLLAPSIFSSAKSEKIEASLYGRTITGAGEVPDFNKANPKETIDSLQIYINGRIGGFGATIGFGQGNEFEFKDPFILSVDYKVDLLKDVPIVDAAIDAQYSMIYLPDEKTIKVSAPGFGVVSINGLVGANLLLFLEPYAGVTLNYVYLNSKDNPFNVWKAIPKLGLKINLLPFISIGSEVSFIKNEILNDSWIWNIGASARF